MIQALDQLDKGLFTLLNGAGSPYLDPVMSMLSARFVWIPLYALIIVWLIRRYGGQTWLPLAYVVIVVVTSDQMTSGWMKPFFERLRPCHDPSVPVSLLASRCGGLYGFASAHAANAMGLAASVMILCGIHGTTLLLMIWAILVGYSRVYLGVHYPGDVLAGMVVGVGAALMWRYLTGQVTRLAGLQSPFGQ